MRVLLASAVALLGCSSAPSPEPIPIAPAPAPAQTAPTEQADAVFDARFHDVGQPCDGATVPIVTAPEAGTRWGVRHGALCDGNRVTAVYHQDAPYATFPQRGILFREQEKTLPSASLEIGASDRFVWARRITCGSCRALMGWGFVGDLTTMTDAQLGEFQAAVDLPRAPALRTRPAWRRALADRGALPPR